MAAVPIDKGGRAPLHPEWRRREKAVRGAEKEAAGATTAVETQAPGYQRRRQPEDRTKKKEAWQMAYKSAEHEKMKRLLLPRPRAISRGNTSTFGEEPSIDELRAPPQRPRPPQPAAAVIAAAQRAQQKNGTRYGIGAWGFGPATTTLAVVAAAVRASRESFRGAAGVLPRRQVTWPQRRRERLVLVAVAAVVLDR